MRYLSFTKYERLKKFVNRETYLIRKADKKEEQISKLEKINEEKEMELLFNQLMEGKSINELDARQMKGLLKVFVAKTAKINERKIQLEKPPNPPSNNKNVISTSLVEDLLNDGYFFETMAAIGDGSGTEIGPTEGNDTNAEDDGHSKDLN
ncbi:hypothetical protein MTR67_052896 [Solanum verrucosum]|uniref:Type I MADS box transcription factor n=1 Tax=Solanum verrucosum TaxID=315347 RepID=A0AAF0V9S6_SOLVR|nr:hypothetical protein MTR67_052896 [Solanum verrucosum]